MAQNKSHESLKEMAKTVREDILIMTTESASGHPGGSLSAADILTVLYFSKMRHNPKMPKWPDRDRLILSKGHAAPLLYSCLAEAGYFPKSELKTLRCLGSRLQGHPEYGSLPGIEASTGSLGQGLSIANGIAMAGRLDGKEYKVYCVIGDGECQEGQVWEAAMTAAHYKLDNVIAILDSNKLQIDGSVCDVKNIEPIRQKWDAFGWHTMEIDGHSIPEILLALDEADKIKRKPVIIIANTVKGKGVPFMENRAEWHGKTLTKEQLIEALKVLS